MRGRYPFSCFDSLGHLSFLSQVVTALNFIIFLFLWTKSYSKHSFRYRAWKEKLVLFHPGTLSHCAFFWYLLCQMSRKFVRVMMPFCVTNCSAALFMNFCQMSGSFWVEKLFAKARLQKQLHENWSTGHCDYVKDVTPVPSWKVLL